jgi:hypothetical protein
MTATPTTTTTPAVVSDFGVTGPSDLGPATDLAPSSTAKWGCKSYAKCNGTCSLTTSTQADFDACSAMCDTQALASASTKLNDVYTCGFNVCGIALRCIGASDTSQGCINCVSNAVAAAFQQACLPANDPICNVQNCQAPVSTCLADLP